MTKSELIEKIAAKNPHLTMKDIERIINVVFDSITDALSNGAPPPPPPPRPFSVRTRSSRMAKNPRTGAQVSVEERRIPHFKTGKQLFESLNKK